MKWCCWYVVASVGVSGGEAVGQSTDAAGATDEVIEVSGRAPEESKPLEYTLTAHDVATTPGAMNDALRAITVLPAAARVPYSLGGIVLRGMSPRDSSIFIDGVEIPVAFHFGGITGVFPTQLLDSMRVVPSGFDVSLGRAQGGVVELTTRTPRSDRYRVGGTLSLLHSQAYAEGPFFGGGAFLLSLRRSYFDVLARPFVSDEDSLPSYSDGQLRAVWGEAGKRGQLAAFVLGAHDRISNPESAAVVRDSDGHMNANLSFVRAGVSYKRKTGASLFTLTPSVGTNILSLYTKDYDNDMLLQELDLARRWYVYGARGEWLRDDPGGFIRAGLDITGGYVGRVSSDTFTMDDTDEYPVPRNVVVWTDVAAFVEARRHWFEDRVSVRSGLRLDRFGLGRQWSLDPRLNAHVSVGETTKLRASVGRFSQPPSPAHFDEVTDNPDAKRSYVDQATLSIEAAPGSGVLASVIGFAHEGKHTLVDIDNKTVRGSTLDLSRTYVELIEEQLGLYGYQANIGRQRSYGIEAALQYDGSRYRALANFAWSRAKRVYEDGTWVPYLFDQPLRLNLVLGTRVRQWNLGARLTVVSGNPVSLVREGTLYDSHASTSPAPELVRLPMFWTVDLRADRSWRRSWGDVLVFFDVQNATNHRNVEDRGTYFEPVEGTESTYTYRHRDNLGLPIIPYVGVELRTR